MILARHTFNIALLVQFIAERTKLGEKINYLAILTQLLADKKLGNAEYLFGTSYANFHRGGIAREDIIGRELAFASFAKAYDPSAPTVNLEGLDVVSIPTAYWTYVILSSFTDLMSVRLYAILVTGIQRAIDECISEYDAQHGSMSGIDHCMLMIKNGENFFVVREVWQAALKPKEWFSSMDQMTNNPDKSQDDEARKKKKQLH